MAYRVEVSTTNRAGCKNKECKDAGLKILKGEMRFGTFVTVKDYQSWQWKHWGCVTPKVISNLKGAVEDDASNLDGYEDLPEELQVKVDKAIEEGHVADNDWRGDVEMNRSGKNGFRTPETKKARKQEAQALKEGGDASPNQSPSKKRGHMKDEPGAADGEDEGPASKKKRGAPKKAKKVKDEISNGPSDEENQPAKKVRKKAAKVNAETAPVIKAEAEDDDDLPVPPAKRSRAPRKATAVPKVKDEESESEGLNNVPEESAPYPAKKSRAPRKAAKKKTIKVDETEGESSETQEPAEKHDALHQASTAKEEEAELVPTAPPQSATLAAAKKKRAPRKKTTTTNIKGEEEISHNTSDLLAGSISVATEQPKDVKLDGQSVHESSAETDAEVHVKALTTGRSKKAAKPTVKGKAKNKASTSTEKMSSESQITVPVASNSLQLVDDDKQQMKPSSKSHMSERNSRRTRSRKD